MITKNNTVSQRVEFDCAYLTKTIGKEGRELQGCRYLVEATVENLHSSTSDMVIEFKQLRSHMIAVVPHHAFLYNVSDPVASAVADMFERIGVSTCSCGFIVCAENICESIGLKLQSILDEFAPGVIVLEVRLRENADSCATFKPVR